MIRSITRVAVLAAAAVSIAGATSAATSPPTTPVAGDSAVPAGTEPTDPPVAPETIDVGTSVEGRPITAIRRGDPDGRPVLVIGVIHGDEAAGLDIVERLATLPVPDGVDLYLVDSMNPDGVAHDVRHNANGVDLNRNFPYNWGPIAEPGNWEYAGPAAASEPETQAMVEFMSALRPDIVIWYHQDAYMIGPAEGRDGAVRARYAELTGLPLQSVSGGTYTGVAAQWARNELASNEGRPGVAFIVELGGTLSPEEADRHADAVMTILGENL